MAHQTKKRSRPIPKSSQRSEKRQRIEIRRKEAAVIKRPVALDALPWNEVEMPNILDDAEGFYGLEEVEGVEVVRDKNTLQFVTVTPKENNEESEFEGFGEVETSDNIACSKLKHEDAKLTALPLNERTSKKEKRKKVKSKDQVLDDFDGNVFKLLPEITEAEDTDMSAWSELDLKPNLLAAIAKLGFLKPTLIQAAAIPEVLAGHDVVGKASTGSGKTLAFAIPIVDHWLESHGEMDDESVKAQRPPFALILSPTRELAHQLTKHTTALCRGLDNGPKVASVTGGLSIQKQQRQLSNSDIIVGTPGRLWEMINSSSQILESFKQIKFLVIDEADRLLTDGHYKEVEEIMNIIDHHQDVDDQSTLSSRQTLVFSATFHRGLQQKLAGKGKQALIDDKSSLEYLLKKLNFREDKPKFVDVNPVSQMAERLKEGIIECSGLEKDLYLYALLLHHPNQRTLIFTNSIHSVKRLTPMLQNLNLSAQSLHSQMAQQARMRSIERFSAPNAKNSILVATDVAARGLDIGGVQLVIHYHLPRAADMYVHRSGRTARADAPGTSILICAPEEVVGMRRLVAKVHAQSAVVGGGTKSKYYMKTLDIDRKIVARLKPRVTLAKKIADSTIAKEKKGHNDIWIKTAAEELGVEYDSEEFEAAGGGRKGRGTGRKLKEKEARELTKNELSALKGELKSLLAHRVNVGVSEKYLTAGTVDINELLEGKSGDFLGAVDGVGMDEI
ncbi:ATP-dependent RNA helicase [Podosphaera aphanis]|nr:ATP-dependent RNA helicase [Podosphaera aphanis]